MGIESTLLQGGKYTFCVLKPAVVGKHRLWKIVVNPPSAHFLGTYISHNKYASMAENAHDFIQDAWLVIEMVECISADY